MVLKRLTYVAIALSLTMASCTQEAAPEATRAPVPVKVAKVSKGNIQSTLAFSGELQALDQVDILPSASGRVQEIMVEEGALVSAGTPIAQMETDTLAAQLRQAEANVLTARARLDTVLKGARPEEIAGAQASLESQRSRLRALVGTGEPNTASVSLEAAAAGVASAQARLDQLKNPTQNDVAVAEAALAAATSNFNKAQAALDLVRNPTTQDVQAAQAAVDSAAAAHQSALAKVKDLQETPKPADVAAARATLAAAETSLKSAENAMSLLRRSLDDHIIEELLDALVDVKNARDKLAYDQQLNVPQSTIVADEEALTLALRRLIAAQEEAGSLNAGVSVEQISNAQATIDSAKASRDSAQARLDLLLAGPTTADKEAAKAAADAALANLTTAKVRLDKLKFPTLADIYTAEAAVDAAKSQQASAEKSLAEVMNPSSTTLRTAESALATADAAYARAQSDIEVQQAAVLQAEQQFSLTIDKFTSADVSSATAGVAQAEAQADLARIQLSRATLIAPFDAIVARKNVSVGATVSGATPVLTVVSQALQVVFNGEEASLAQLRVGQPVSLTVAAFGESKPFRATLASISPVADPASRTFRVKAIPAAGQEGLRAGMFANVVVTTQAQSNVLLIPQEALVQRGQDALVFVIADDKAEQRKIEIGLRNDRFIQVRSGLEEGDQVVTQGNRTLRAQDMVAIAQ